MLSWSGKQQGADIDLANVQAARGGVAVDLATELMAFATAATASDEIVLQDSREVLIERAGRAITIDAAAVIANFEMMTRLADSTGARLPTEIVADRLAIVKTMGLSSLLSRR